MSEEGFGTTWMCNACCRREFEVVLPSPGHPEFVVPRARFDAAIEREWAAPQRCQVSAKRLCISAPAQSFRCLGPLRQCFTLVVSSA